MYQSDRGNYRTKQSFLGMFWSSCLGKIAILGIIVGFFSIIAYMTNPSENYMMDEMTDNICQHLERSDSVLTDKLDDGVYNIGYIFSTTDTKESRDILTKFNRFNRMLYFDHGIYSTVYLYNNYHPEGIRIGFGIFGLVIPTILSGDIVIDVAPIRKDYNYKLIPERPVEEDSTDDVVEFYKQEDLEFEIDDEEE